MPRVPPPEGVLVLTHTPPSALVRWFQPLLERLRFSWLEALGMVFMQALAEL